MLCNWTITFAGQPVTIDDERGEEPGARFHLTSDWGDDFIVFGSKTDGLGYTLVSEWARAEDDGLVPDYLWDVLPDLTNNLATPTSSGTVPYQIDIAPNRVGNETARQRWIAENS